LYTTHCPKCKILEEKLQEKNLKYVTVTLVEVMKGKGFRSVPILEVDGVEMTYLTAINFIKEI
jgi:glutaredoxin